MLFHVAEVMRLLSSIIKGQRIRSESTLEIKSENLYIAPESGDKNLIVEQAKQEVKKDHIQKQMKKIELQAQAIIEEAKKEATLQADLIIMKGKDEAKQESLVILEKAREEGYLEGYEKGELEAKALIEEGKQVLLDAQAQKQQILSQAEPEIIEMIIAICEKLISEEVNYNQETIFLLIRKALQEVSADGTDAEISIKVPPDEYDYVLENRDSIVKNVSNPSKIKILSDMNLNKGVCVVETAFGSVECNIGESFAEVKKQMRLICNKK